MYTATRANFAVSCFHLLCASCVCCVHRHRAGHVARTVWALLDAASQHGLDVLVPEERPQLLHPVKPTATNRSARPSSHPDAGGKGRASEAGRKGAGGATAVGAAVRAGRDGRAGGGGEERAGVGCEVDNPNGAEGDGGAGDKGAESGVVGMDVCAEGVTEGQLDDGDVAGDGNGSAGDGSAGIDSGRGVGDGGADMLSAGAHSKARSEVHEESALGSVDTAGNFETGDSSMDDTGSSWTDNGATTRVVACPEVAAVAVTTRSGGKKHMSALVAEEEQQIAPPPPPVAGEGGESSALPPKPKMSQVTYYCILPLLPLFQDESPHRAGTICRHKPGGKVRNSDAILPG